MAGNRTVYTEIAKAKVKENRNIVISDCSRGGFTIAQQLIAKEGSDETNVFMKGAFHVGDIDGLYNLRDCLNLVIQIVENRENGGEVWDE